MVGCWCDPHGLTPGASQARRAGVDRNRAHRSCLPSRCRCLRHGGARCRRPHDARSAGAHTRRAPRRGPHPAGAARPRRRRPRCHRGGGRVPRLGGHVPPAPTSTGPTSPTGRSDPPSSTGRAPCGPTRPRPARPTRRSPTPVRRPRPYRAGRAGRTPGSTDRPAGGHCAGQAPRNPMSDWYSSMVGSDGSAPNRKARSSSSARCTLVRLPCRAKARMRSW